MTRNVSACAIAVFMALALVACGGSGSPTSPSRSSSTNSTPTTDFSTQAFQKVGRVTAENKYYVQWYGNLNLLQDLSSNVGIAAGGWDGAMFYLRQYWDNGARRESWVVQFANSTPIGNTNVTLVRDVTCGGTIDFDLLVAPLDRNHKELPRVQVMYANKSNSQRFQLIPSSLRITDDGRTQGQLPAVGSLTASVSEGLEVPYNPNVPPARLVLIEERQSNGTYREVWKD